MMACIATGHRHCRAAGQALAADRRVWRAETFARAIGSTPTFSIARKDPAMDRIFTKVASAISAAAGQPMAFVLALLVILVWAVSGPVFAYSDTWQLVVNTGTTIVTFLMVFLIQNSQNRDAAAMQAKLDELIRAVVEAREEYIGIEHLTDQEIEEIRRKLESECTQPAEQHKDRGPRPPSHQSVGRLLERY
jgi:low affinity Fe/Cu permease